MAMKFWQVDAFTDQPFKGNPAAVVITEKELPATLMQNIAAEMNLSETAFVETRANANPLLRWFTPKIEVDLCGHATLASAHVYLNKIRPELKEVTFDTKFVGPLQVTFEKPFYTMNFPARGGERVDLKTLPNFLVPSLGEHKPKEAFIARDLMLVYEDESVVREMTPNFSEMIKYDKWVIVTAPSKKYDFISRFFNANDGNCEDAVTGSAHCTLTPYWSARLVKKKMNAYQASERGGELIVELKEDRVFISGKAVTVFSGTIEG